jgi:MYXO-CTERM domain-containing protein
MRKLALGLALAGAVFASSPAPARAFCGFYVSGADASLYNNATQVVLMRDGVRTVLSMANNYQGPPQDFAMVVPVPVVLHKENVKTLSAEIFARVDKLAAPRLVEYWEQDPCRPPEPPVLYSGSGPASDSSGEEAARVHGVKIEAQFSVGEYDVVILSAQDALGLDAFLRGQGYHIPAGAAPYLRPYVTGGSKFFVAKVDVKKVRFVGGQAMLSPLRFHYDAETFSLPVRLGLINSAGAQDLIVHVLGRARYEVANYENVAIPTNIDVTPEVRDRFGAFYAALFDSTLARHPRAVVTEYAWAAGSCDPCPEPPLTPSEVAALGADALPTVASAVASGEVPPDFAQNLTLTRLHVRYGKDSLGEDLVFRAVGAIEGGRGVPGPKGELPRGALGSSYNNFQGRYVIRHPWTGPVNCAEPRRGIWGEPWQQVAGGAPGVKVAVDTAFAPRTGVDLGAMLAHGAGDLDSEGKTLPSKPLEPPAWPKIQGAGCASCSVAAGSGALPAGALAAAALAALSARRQRRRGRGRSA